MVSKPFLPAFNSSRLLIELDISWVCAQLCRSCWYVTILTLQRDRELILVMCDIRSSLPSRLGRSWSIPRSCLLYVLVRSHCLHLLISNGLTFVVHSWYKRSELGTRVAVFFSSATVAGAFSEFFPSHLDSDRIQTAIFCELQAAYWQQLFITWMELEASPAGHGSSFWKASSPCCAHSHPSGSSQTSPTRRNF